MAAMTDVLQELEEFFGLLQPHPKPVPPPVIHIGAPADPLPDQALTFVETEEDGSPVYYARHYTHWECPGGASGPTCGIGYDFGWVTHDEAVEDWQGIVDEAMLEQMLKAVGFKGAAARNFVNAHGGDITITWDQAIREFKEREVPKWLTRCRAVLPHFDTLPGLSKGSLFSVTYNRGSGGYDDPSPRYAEMRQIKKAMIAEDFVIIPSLIMSMQRLWPPSGSDLWRRRAHESALFQQGLDQAKQPEAAAV